MMLMMLLTTVMCLPQYSSQYDEEYYNYDEYQDYYDEPANIEDMVSDSCILCKVISSHIVPSSPGQNSGSTNVPFHSIKCIQFVYFL